MPVSELLRDNVLEIEESFKEKEINCFYYYVPWILAQSEDPDLYFDYIEDIGGIIVENEGYKRFYCTPFYLKDWKKEYPQEIIFSQRPMYDGEYHKIDVNYINDPLSIVEKRGDKFKELRHAINNCEKTLASLNKPIVYESLQNTPLREIYKFVSPLCEKDELRVVKSLLISALYFNDMEINVLKVGDEIFSVNIWGELCKDVIIHLVNKNKPKIPFLSDYSRYRFYSDIKNECVEVNDGSDLDDAGLRQFKRKFNPIRVDDIFTLVKRD